MTQEISLIVGLGNPGQPYQDTRHNAGYWFTDLLCHQKNISLTPEIKYQGRVGTFTHEGKMIRILQPTTYMNLSGESVQKLAHFYKISPESLLVVHDELDLPPGSMRLKFDGGHGGHNGLKDIIARLNTKAFHRLRIGIGHPGHKDDVHDYVLQKPSQADRAAIHTGLEEALFVLPDILAGHFEKAQTQLHTACK